MKTVIIKYNAGNTQSVIFALQRMGIEPILSNDPEEIKSADKVIFPGVGEAVNTMRHLSELGMDRLIPSLTQPVLGICLGMQVMCRHSEEGETPCMGIFETTVKKFVRQKGSTLKVPHMGWNTLGEVGSPLMDNTLENQHVYFVHSYYVPLGEHTIAATEYIHPFSAALRKDNFYAVQFHPEKSAGPGAKILENFIAI